MRFKDGEDIDNNVWQREYEEKLGIKLNYLWSAIYEGGAYDQKLNLAISSGDLPDIFQVNAQQLKQLVEAGLVEDMTDVFDQYASDFLRQSFEEAGEQYLLSATFGGRLYALPGLASALDTAPVMYVRKDWREKLGLPEPKTMQDVINMALAFANNDPDGNGVKDTYGIALTKDAVVGTGFADLQGFMNGFHAYLNIWIEDDSGNLVYGAIQPEVKQALQ
jgi:putative aldouronate transport system substrate-binding protein